MNYIRHLNAFFFQHVKRDKRFNANHVSLYIALFQFWNYNRFQNPFSIVREEVMSITGIGSKNTYHKCLKELHQYGYIHYRPSQNKFQKCKVHMIRLDSQEKEGPLKQLDLFENPDPVSEISSVNSKTTVPELILSRSQFCYPISPVNDTDAVPNMGLLIKHKHLNIKGELTQKNISKNVFLEKCINDFAAIPKAVPKAEIFSYQAKQKAIPTIEEVIFFFEQNKYPESEAKKFFNHYQSVGWLVGGKSPMVDWHSSVHKWILTSIKFNLNQFKSNVVSKEVEYVNHKDFSEPL